jgi:hypothetical protein
MTAKSSVASHLVGPVIAAMVLVVSATAPIQAQQAPGNAGGTMTGTSTGLNRGTKDRPVAHKPANQAAAKPRAAASGQSKAVAPDGKPWSIEDALPSHQPSAVQRQGDIPTVSRPSFGRVPAEGGTGTFGLATDTKVKSNELSDGRPVPGLEANTRKPSSYLGLSLSVPTNDKSLVPVPLPVLPPFGRRD